MTNWTKIELYATIRWWAELFCDARGGPFVWCFVSGATARAATGWASRASNITASITNRLPPPPPPPPLPLLLDSGSWMASTQTAALPSHPWRDGWLLIACCTEWWQWQSGCIFLSIFGPASGQQQQQQQRSVRSCTQCTCHYLMINTFNGIRHVCTLYALASAAWLPVNLRTRKRVPKRYQRCRCSCSRSCCYQFSNYQGFFISQPIITELRT